MPAAKKNKEREESARITRVRRLSGDAYTIRLKPRDAVDGFFVLATNGQTTRLPNNTYIVGKEHLDLLKKAKIDYELAKD